jgi:subtilisin family serine protease
MENYPGKIDLIIHAPTIPTKGGSVSKSKPEFVKKLKAEGIRLQLEDFTRPSRYKTKGISKGLSGSSKMLAKTNLSASDLNPWDLAHLVNDQIRTMQSFVEPDPVSEFIIDQKVFGGIRGVKGSILKGENNGDNFDPDWNPHANTIWHLGKKYSQLQDARKEVMNNGDGYMVRIGHLDTGYSSHPQNPPLLSKTLQKNFVEGEDSGDARDRNARGTLKMPGHGTGTVCILAGNKYQSPDGAFNDYLGGAPFAEIIPCRISNSVVLLKASSFARALQYLVDLTYSGIAVQAVSMSMGGVPSQLWADVVNAAYEAGITVVTAAGNNFNGLPTRKLIYPARFRRVIAACGVTYDFAPYFHKKPGEMQGNWGPQKNMSRAMAAFTPNTPWAMMMRKTISFSGAGTSSATPQIAAAAACYYKKYHAELDSLEPWKRVEAIRHALYSTALKKVYKGEEPYPVYFGNGILQAADALKVPVKKTGLVKSEADEIPFLPLLSIIIKGKLPVSKSEMNMYNVELAQLIMLDAGLASLLDDEEKDFAALSIKKKKQVLDMVIAKKESSKKLREFIKVYYSALTGSLK